MSATRFHAEAQASLPHGSQPAPTARLALHGVSFRYRDREVLRDVGFEVGAGEIVGLLGPNGAGKSTLFSILAGLLEPAAGRLIVDGARVRFGARALRARMGVVFQAPSLDAKLSAEENLVLGGQLFGMARAAARVRARELLASAALLDRARDAAGKLSGGMRRRLELARALVPRPSILLMDEPTNGLDAAAFRQTWETVQRLRSEERLTVLLTTHRPDEAEQCDRLVVLAGGSVVAAGTPDELRSTVRGDVITIDAAEPEALAADVRARLGVTARATATGVHVERERGHELVPRIVEAFPPGRLRSVSLHRPTLADAFLSLTGLDLGQEEDAP